MIRASIGLSTVLLILASTTGRVDTPEPAWTKAHLKPAMTRDETRAFMKKLAQYVFDHHLKKTGEQRGMLYEYLDTARMGQHDQFVQGEALDTMHDGAWFAVAMVNAYRATGDPFYKEFLTKWILPFYLKMLNHSDDLFSAKTVHAREGAPMFDREHALQEGEKGFVPYWWDDGGSVSLERRRSKRLLPEFPALDHFIANNLPNNEYRLRGYSLGSSNHMAQDLGVMVMQSWLLVRDALVAAGFTPADVAQTAAGVKPAATTDARLLRELTEAAKNLHQCRMNHHGHIPMCCAPLALTTSDAEELKRIPDQSGKDTWTPNNHYTRALYDFKPGQRYPFPGFADDQQYRYYFGLAKHGGALPKALAFKTIYDAYTEPMLYRYYSEDAPVPPGINRFDLHPYYAKDGKLEDYRSDRKGPRGRPRPAGSRFGPQNMVCTGWALQALKEWPGIWTERYRSMFNQDAFVQFADTPAGMQSRNRFSPTRLFGQPELHIMTSMNGLIVEGASGIELPIKVFSRSNAQGSHALLKVNKLAKSFAVFNERGESLVMPGEIDDAVFFAELQASVVKGQNAWANMIQHGRYSIRMGNEVVNFYAATPESTISQMLEHELAGGLRTWEAIFNEYGYIPTGLGTNSDWDRYSDTGGYAHLISAAAQWLLYLDGKKDWEVQQVPRVAP